MFITQKEAPLEKYIFERGLPSSPPSEKRGKSDGGKGYGSVKGAVPLTYKAVYASFARAFRRSIWASVKVALSSARAAFATAAIEVAYRSP